MAVEVKLRPAQMEVFRCPKRFRVLVAGRRFGKTHLALVELVRAAWGRESVVWYVAPSYRQAKEIAWRRLKELTRPYWEGRPNETDARIRLRGGGTIALRGADRYDSLRGSGLDFVVLDEYGSMKPECWSEVLRPALSDRQGGALFIGTPQGSNHLFEKFEQARQDPEWSAFRFTTAEGGNVCAEELASAARELDGRLYPSYLAATSNPGVRDRVSLVNGRLCSASGERSLFVDPRCKELIRDLERVRWKADVFGQAMGELDKTDRMRTHVSDALGYYVAQKLAIRARGGLKGDGRVV